MVASTSGRPLGRWAARTSRAHGWTRSTSGFDRPLAGPAGRRRPSGLACTVGGGPGQCDEGYRLAEAVVEAVEQPVTGQVPALGDDPFGLHRLVEDRARWPSGCSVRSRSTKTAPGGSVMPSRYRRPGSRVVGADARSVRHGRRTGFGPRTRQRDRRGGGGPFALTQQGKEGDSLDPVVCSTSYNDREQSVKQLISITAIILSDGTPAPPGADRDQRPRHLLGRGRAPQHRAVEHLRPRGPPRAGARRPADRPGRRPADRGGHRWWWPGPDGSSPSSTPWSPTSPPARTRSPAPSGSA